MTDPEQSIPALFTIILMPLTYDIAIGIGAGVITYVFIKVVRGKFREIHWLMWGAAVAFLVFFLKDWIELVLNPVAA